MTNDNRELTAAPEVRFNPANGAVAVRTIDSAYSSTPWRGIVGHLSDDDVADWTPMVPGCSADLAGFRCVHAAGHKGDHLALPGGDRRIEWSINPDSSRKAGA